MRSDNLGKETDFKSIELLKQLTGTDDKSEEVDKEAISAAATNNALEIVCKSIADNHYDNKYIEYCKPLLQSLGEDPSNAGKYDGLIDSLLSKMEQFNSMSPAEKAKPENLENVVKANDQLNALCLVEPLRKYAFEKGHTQTIGNLWSHINELEPTEAKDNKDALNKRAEKGCVIAAVQHLTDAEENPSALKDLFGDPKAVRLEMNSPNLLINALKSLQKNSKHPDLVLSNAKIINSCFPSSFAPLVKSAAKQLNFQPDLDFIFKSYGSSEDKDLAQESTNLFVNLSENQDDDMIEKIIKKNLRKLNQDLSNSNAADVEESLNALIPLIKHPIFSEKMEGFDIIDQILRTLKLLHAKCAQKLNKTATDLLREGISNSSIPDLGPNNRKTMNDELQLAKSPLYLHKKPARIHKRQS